MLLKLSQCSGPEGETELYETYRQTDGQTDRQIERHRRKRDQDRESRFEVFAHLS